MLKEKAKCWIGEIENVTDCEYACPCLIVEVYGIPSFKGESRQRG